MSCPRDFPAYEELIPDAQQYIASRASRRFQERMSGSQVTDQFAVREEALARAQLEAAAGSAAGYNILTDNLPSLDVVRRDRW